MTLLDRKMKGRYHISDSWMLEHLSDNGDKVEIINSFLSSIIFFSIDFWFAVFLSLKCSNEQPIAGQDVVRWIEPLEMQVTVKCLVLWCLVFVLILLLIVLAGGFLLQATCPRTWMLSSSASGLVSQNNSFPAQMCNSKLWDVEQYVPFSLHSPSFS